MHVPARRLSFISLLLVAVVSAASQKPKCPWELCVPEIRMLPYYHGLEFPIWAVNMGPAGGLAQHGGIHSFAYTAETVAGRDGVEVVEVSNLRFKESPGWDMPEWLEERLQIARDYADRSKYWITRPISERGKPIRGSKVETTFGITWSEYSRKDIEGKPQSAIYNDPKIRLPEEKTLRRTVKRHYVSNDRPDPEDRGLAIEFRAVSKDPHSTPDSLRDEGMAQMIQGILERTKEYPELYDEPIVTCYADEGHKSLYEHWFKMKMQRETTPPEDPAYIHDKNGTANKKIPWWYIEVTPRMLEEVLQKRLKGGRSVSNFNLPHDFRLPDGRTATAPPKSPLGFDSEGNVTLATFQSRTELAKGIVASAGSTAFWHDQNLVRLTSIAEPYHFTHGLIEAVAPAGSTLEWDSPYVEAWLASQEDNVYYSPNLNYWEKPVLLTPEMWAFTISHLRAEASARARKIVPSKDESEPEFVEEMNRQARLLRKESGPPKVFRLVSDPSHPIRVNLHSIEATRVEVSRRDSLFRLAKDTSLGAGIVAKKGTDVQFESTPDGMQWAVLCLAKDVTIGSKVYRKDSVLVRMGSEIVEYPAK